MTQRQHHSADQRLRPGEVVDNRYVVEAFVAQGGMGSIYKARHIHIQRLCALKVMSSIPNEVHLNEFQQRFLAEAQAAARIHDAAVITIYDFGFLDHSGFPYIAMEWMEGHNLAAELEANGPLHPHRAIARFTEVLRGLAVAHAADIIHKDIKPENLFLSNPCTPAEMLRMVDFGIARLNSEARQGLTRAGEFVGTPRYLSPEYISHNVVTPAMDVYAMGIVLVEMLTAEPVVPAGSAIQMMVAHSRGELNIPAALLNGPLGPVIRRATAVRIEDRYADANDFLLALRDAAAEFLRYVEQATPARAASSASLRAVRTPTPQNARTLYGAPMQQPTEAAAPPVSSSLLQHMGTVLSTRPPVSNSHEEERHPPTQPTQHPRPNVVTRLHPHTPPPPTQTAPKVPESLPPGWSHASSHPATSDLRVQPNTGPGLASAAASVSSDALIRPNLDEPPISQFDTMFRTATQAYVRRDFDKALEIFEECARQRPADSRIRHNISMITTRLSRARPEE